MAMNLNTQESEMTNGDNGKNVQKSFFNILDNTKNVQTRTDIEAGNTILLDSNIILPYFFYEGTVDLANQPKEHRWILLTTKENKGWKDFYVVKYMKILGSGTATSVYLDDKKFQAIKILISRHPELKVIEFHTHTQETWTYREDKFSWWDYNGIEKALLNNIEYIHVLFTPTHILTIGKKKTNVSLAKHWVEAWDILEIDFEKINQEFNEIFRNEIR